jgi:uncharacterized protein YcnI
VTEACWIRRLALWTAISAFVVLAARAVVYALAPNPNLADQLQRSAGGPRLVVVALVALGLGVASAVALLWLAAIAVQERHALAGVSYPAPRLRLVPTLLRAMVLWVMTSLAFALVESAIHWCEGLGFHGLECLLGPVHRNAIPILAALSILAAAAVAAVAHVLAWLRRALPLPLVATGGGGDPPPSPIPAYVGLPQSDQRRAQGRPRSPPRLGRPRPGIARTFVQPRRGGHVKKSLRRSRRLAVAWTVGAVAALAGASGAWAHAIVSPPVAQSKVLQVFTLSVPTEKEGLTTTKIELTVPDGFAIDSFEPVPGWRRVVKATGSGEEAIVQSVTWLGGHTPTEADAMFRFNASADAAKTYTFAVRQTYSDGSVVDWNGSEASDTPAPRVEALSSFGGGGTSTLAIIAIVLGAVALVVAIVGLVGRRGGRSLA